MSDGERNLAIEVIERVKQAEKLRFDVDVAPVLGVAKTMIGKWKARGTVPFEKLVEYSEKTGVSLDWLFHGWGPIRVEGIAEGRGTYTARPVIDSDLYVAIGQQVDRIFEEAGVEPDNEKRDRLVVITYNDMVKEGAESVAPDKLMDLAKLVG